METMDTLTDEQVEFMDKILTFLLYLETITLSQNEMMSPQATKGDLISSWVIYNNNITTSMAKEILDSEYMKEYISVTNEAERKKIEEKYQEVN